MTGYWLSSQAQPILKGPAETEPLSTCYTMSDTPLHAAVKRLSGTYAELDYDGRTLQVPQATLPSGISEGDDIVITLQTIEQAETDRHEFARALLTEILGGNS